MNAKKEVTNILINSEIIFFSPNDTFTWSSGIKSPIYCDNRLILGKPNERTVVVDALAAVITKQYPEATAIMGVATGGIAIAALVAQKLNLPNGYVRGDNKKHGRNNCIEGGIDINSKIVVIEDLVSTAESAIKAVNKLTESGYNVLGLASIFTYNLEIGNDNLKANNIINHSITDFNFLIEMELANKKIDQNTFELFKNFKTNPNDWFNK